MVHITRLDIPTQEIIDNLEQQIRWIEDIPAHQFAGWGNVTGAIREAVTKLKEQENKLTYLRRDCRELRELISLKD